MNATEFEEVALVERGFDPPSTMQAEARGA